MKLRPPSPDIPDRRVRVRDDVVHARVALTRTPDFLHLGRAGAQAEAEQLDLQFFAPPKRHY
jgi:hypothetical protein